MNDDTTCIKEAFTDDKTFGPIHYSKTTEFFSDKPFNQYISAVVIGTNLYIHVELGRLHDGIRRVSIYGGPPSPGNPSLSQVEKEKIVSEITLKISALKKSLINECGKDWQQLTFVEKGSH